MHLRTYASLVDIIAEAQAHNSPFFQFFLTNHETGKYLKITPQDIDDFNAARQQASFSNLFIHSSYWINPSTGDKYVLKLSRRLLKRELKIAAALGVSYLILHAGSASCYPATIDDPTGKQRALATLVETLDKVLLGNDKVTILLENSAVGGKTLGNTLDDFVGLREKLLFPERVAFCLDTAHAYAYGYDIKKFNCFLQELDAKIGLKNIKLIHFNDLASKFGCMQDRHAIPGRGTIGKEALLKFLYCKNLEHAYKIVEYPACNAVEIKQSFIDITQW